jgi:hypothetical protein
MAAHFGGDQRVLYQCGADPEVAARGVNRQRAEHQRSRTSGADVPQPQRPDQPALRQGRKRKAFGGRVSVAQALAGARMAVFAKAGIKQRFARNDIRGSFRTDRERSGIGVVGNLGLPQLGHGTSVLAATGDKRRRSVVSKFANEGMGAGGPAPGLSRPLKRPPQMW